MRKVSILLSALVLLSVSSAQSQTTFTGPSQGSKAILFNFQGLSTLNLNDYPAQYGIGGKYFISKEMAIRAMLLFGMNNQTTKTTPEQTDNSLTFGIGGALEYHLPLSASVSPYVGGGLAFSSSTNKTNAGFGEAKSTSTTFQLGALAGVEYFFNQSLSLGAEYQLGIISTSNSPFGGPKTSDFSFGIQTFGLTMSVYF
jgi:opacity protein-like surface antigen